MKMIDADRLLEQLNRLAQWNNSDVPDWVVDVINGMPSEQEIIRCKDCIRRGSDRCPFNRQYHYNGMGINITLDYTRDDGFCSYAERREA